MVLPDVKANVSGRFDRVDIVDYPKSIKIVDWKTGKYEMTEDELKNDIQYSMYSYLMQKKYPLFKEYVLEWRYLQTNNRIELPAIEMKKAEEIIVGKIKEIQNTERAEPKKNKFCKKCNFYDNKECPLRKKENK
jgi:ATP-dependent helicase/DNAse subunit B